jgi:hypothetical protein
MRNNEIWIELESDNYFETGLLLRRYSADIIPNVFVALLRPEKQRCIALKLSLFIKPDLARFNNLKDIKIDFISDDKNSGFYYLTIILINSDHGEVFSVFCEDLVSAVSSIADDNIVLEKLLNRLEKWKSLFDKASFSGLNPEEQVGLYGELFFIRLWINKSSNLNRCIHAWVGPDMEIRDFQLNDWGLEVKASKTKNHQKVYISSERQLDTSNLNNLILFHLSLEEQQDNGETLNEIVDEISDKLQNNTITLTEYKTKLFQAGYYKHHAVIYDAIGYQIRSISYYLVRDEFPRIEESDVRKGVGNIKYSIVLSDCMNYLINENVVFEIINKYD